MVRGWPPNEHIQITEPNLLLVEGKDEENFFGALIEHLGLQKIQVEGIAGKSQLPGNLEVWTKTPGFKELVSLAVVRDADQNADNTFRSVCGALNGVDLPVPEAALVPSGGDPQVTVMILPVGSVSGALEDVCLNAVEQDPAMGCVDKYFRCLKRELACLPRNMSKAKVQAFLASRPKEGKRLGEAACARYWPFDHQAFAEIKTFLEQVCVRQP